MRYHTHTNMLGGICMCSVIYKFCYDVVSVIKIHHKEPKMSIHLVSKCLTGHLKAITSCENIFFVQWVNMQILCHFIQSELTPVIARTGCKRPLLGQILSNK